MNKSWLALWKESNEHVFTPHILPSLLVTSVVTSFTTATATVLLNQAAVLAPRNRLVIVIPIKFRRFSMRITHPRTRH